MPFRLQPQDMILELGPEYADAQVRVRLSVPLGQALELMGSTTVLDEEGLMEDKRALFDTFCRIALVSWDIETADGEPVPANTEGMMMLPAALALSIIGEWTRGIQGELPDPLDGALQNGSMSGQVRSDETGQQSHSL